MSQLTYLIDEICAGVEIYFTGRTGGQYLKTAFILCDDYTELTSKLFLITNDSSWSDKRPNGNFKNYGHIQVDVQNVFTRTRLTDLPTLQTIHRNMQERRKRRNDFFHSTHLLDLSVTPRNCVESFCELLDYGALLFGTIWDDELQASRNLDMMEILLRLEKKSFGDPAITQRVNKLLSECPRNRTNSSKKGVHQAEHPEDLHLRLSLIYGGKDLRDKLASLL